MSRKDEAPKKALALMRKGFKDTIFTCKECHQLLEGFETMQSHAQNNEHHSFDIYKKMRAGLMFG